MSDQRRHHYEKRAGMFSLLRYCMNGVVLEFELGS